MTWALTAGIVLLAVLLSLISTAQLLYMEALRLRPRELPFLQTFKADLENRLGLDIERGVLSFSLLKHTVLAVLVALFLVVTLQHGPTTGRLAEAVAGAWLTLLGAVHGLPQILYRRTDGTWLRPLVPFLKALALLIRPVVLVFEFLRSVLSLGEAQPASEEASTAADNIEALISAGTEEGLIEESDRELIQSVVAFGDKTVREVMTPRPNIVAIAADRSLEELRELVINEQYSRIPVMEDSIDSIIGFVHVRDMFELDQEERARRKVRELVRPMPFIPETKPVHEMIKELQHDRTHMAIVVDEYGNTAGLVTLEDLVEEVFGEIQDEHEPERDIVQEPGGAFVVSGNFGVDRLEELVDFRAGEETESTTVGGLVMEWLGRVPHAGETVERDGIRLEVLASNELHVEQVRISQNLQHA